VNKLPPADAEQPCARSPSALRKQLYDKAASPLTSEQNIYRKLSIEPSSRSPTPSSSTSSPNDYAPPASIYHQPIPSPFRILRSIPSAVNLSFWHDMSNVTKPPTIQHDADGDDHIKHDGDVNGDKTAFNFHTVNSSTDIPKKSFIDSASNSPTSANTSPSSSTNRKSKSSSNIKGSNGSDSPRRRSKHERASQSKIRAADSEKGRRPLTPRDLSKSSASPSSSTNHSHLSAHREIG